jgi:hypothetical protein
MTTLDRCPCLFPSHGIPTQITCLTYCVWQQQTTLLLMLVSQATLIRRAHTHGSHRLVINAVAMPAITIAPTTTTAICPIIDHLRRRS